MATSDVRADSAPCAQRAPLPEHLGTRCHRWTGYPTPALTHTSDLHRTRPAAAPAELNRSAGARSLVGRPTGSTRTTAHFAADTETAPPPESTLDSRLQSFVAALAPADPTPIGQQLDAVRRQLRPPSGAIRLPADLMAQDAPDAVEALVALGRKEIQKHRTAPTS